MERKDHKETARERNQDRVVSQTPRRKVQEGLGVMELVAAAGLAFTGLAACGSLMTLPKHCHRIRGGGSHTAVGGLRNTEAARFIS